MRRRDQVPSTPAAKYVENADCKLLLQCDRSVIGNLVFKVHGLGLDRHNCFPQPLDQLDENNDATSRSRVAHCIGASPVATAPARRNDSPIILAHLATNLNKSARCATKGIQQLLFTPHTGHFFLWPRT